MTGATGDGQKCPAGTPSARVRKESLPCASTAQVEAAGPPVKRLRSLKLTQYLRLHSASSRWEDAAVQ